MSKIIGQIKQPITHEMELFEKKFHQYMSSKVPLLDRITHYIVRRKGKQMRPMFVFLTANLIAKTTERSYKLAAMIELIHTATLVHDDVVDDSDLRRGFFSINALWKNKIAVLVGDYMLSKSLLMGVDNDDFDLLKVISIAIKEMSEGELLQIEKARKLDITEDVYFEIIRQKTASLIAACCEGGARSVGCDDATAKQMNNFGKLIGVAFQIKDDLFDFTCSQTIGKPIGIDIKEQKMTLPLIHTLNTTDAKSKRWLLNCIKNHNTDNKKVKEVIAFVNQNGGLEYAQQKMITYKNEAIAILDGYPDSPYKTSLQIMVNYVIDRDN